MLTIMQIISAIIMKFFDAIRGRQSANAPPERLRGDIGLEASEPKKGWWDYW
jgi:hypothetical protein